jgi:hypothetical protein
VTEIWDKFKYDNEYDALFRYLALQNMNSICLVEPKVIDFLTKIKNSTKWQPLSQQDIPRKMVERILLKDLVFKEKNKIKHWQFLYQTLKEDKKEVQQFYSENPQAKINQKDKPNYFLNGFANEFKKYETQ